MANQISLNLLNLTEVLSDSNGLNLLNPLQLETLNLTMVLAIRPKFSIDVDGVTLLITDNQPGYVPVKIKVTDSLSQTFEKTFMLSITD